jgi:hypothetical protein
MVSAMDPRGGLSTRWPDTRGGSAGRLVLGLIFLGVTFLLASFVVPDIVPNIRASRGDGSPGVFMAERHDCTKRCLWYGEFRPGSGGASRRGVWIEGIDDDDLEVGATIQAMDTGARGNVYSPDGSPHWLGLIGGCVLTLSSVVATGHLLWRGSRGLFRRRPA